jgi:hypothetical protein
MGGSKTKTVGGTPTTPVARDFTNFLGSSIGQTGQLNTALTGLLSGGNVNTNLNDYLKNQASSSGYNVPTIQAPTFSGIGEVPGATPIDLTAGMGGSAAPATLAPTTANISAPSAGGVASYNPANPADYFSGIQLPNNVASALNPRLLQQLLNSTNYQTPGTIDPTSLYSNNTNIPGQIGNNIDISALLSGSNINLPNQVGNNLPADLASRFAPTDLGAITANDPQVQAIMELVNRNVNDQVLASRERFTATGGGAGRGTPGAYAEATIRSQAAPAIANELGTLATNRANQVMQNTALNQNAATALAGILGNERGQDITQRGTDIAALLQQAGLKQEGSNTAINALLTGRGQDIQQRATDITALLTQQGMSNEAASQIANVLTTQRGQDINAGLTTAGLDQQGISTILNSLLTGRGQDIAQRGQNIDASVAGAGLDLNALQTILGNNTANRGLDVTARGQDLTAGLQAAGLGLDQAKMINDFILNQRGQDITNSNTNRQLDVAQMGQLADYLTQNRGLDINALIESGKLGLGYSGLDLQGQIANAGNTLETNKLNASTNLQQQQLAQEFARIQQQGQLAALQQLFNSLNGVTALGTPQAQTVKKPSTFENILGATNAIANLAGAFMGGK